jgi:predicted metal-dependent phosphoesterase TrpH
MGSSAMGKADLHIHSGAGDGMADVLSILEHVEHHTDLDVIAITDHDDMEGSYQARELAQKGRYRFDLVMGMEVTTLAGHLLALYIERPVPSYRRLEATLEAIHAQGGLCVVPHPLSWLTRSIGKRALDRITRAPSSGVYFDAIELITANLAGRVTYRKAKVLNERCYHLPEAGGSDAHFLPQVGNACTAFPGHSAEDLRHSIFDGSTRTVSYAPAGLKEIGYAHILGQQAKSLVILPCQLLAKRSRRLLRR